MKAMLFAAGLGTRLKPLTDTTPKALVRVDGKPLLQHNIERLKAAGIQDIVLNVHHFADQIITFLEEQANFGCQIQISDERDALLDTGGGLKKAAPLLESKETIVIQNADILSNINYRHMLDQHVKRKALATLAVRQRESSRYLLFNTDKQLKGWINTQSGETIPEQLPQTNLKRLAFSGIHLIQPELLQLFPDSSKFNIIQWYLQLAQKETITGYEHSADYWFDIGTLEKRQQAETYFKQLKT